MPRIATHIVVLQLGNRVWQAEPGKPFRIGRHQANDMLLADIGASRFHAQILWCDGVPVLQDLHSANGTFLGGRRVRTPTPLRSGQRILIGNARIDVDLVEDLGPAILKEESADLKLFTETGAAAVRGSFTHQASLHRLLLDLEDEQRTGTLELRLGVRRAQVVFSLGRIATASHQQLRGIQALRRILDAAVGSFCFRPSFEVGDEDPYLGLSPKAHLRQGSYASTRLARQRTRKFQS